jgi:hypothetical protein
VEIIGRFDTIKVNSGIKIQPFSLEYFGKSGVGKSTISAMLTTYFFECLGISNEPGRKYTRVVGKKHWDGARSDITVVTLDDVANAKPQFEEGNACDEIISLCNNVPFSPPMAELNDKARVWLQPELVNVTTNVMSMGAEIKSHNPGSVQRRMLYVLDVVVKDEFCFYNRGVKTPKLDQDKVMKHYTTNGVYDPPLLQDLWIIDIYRAVSPDDERYRADYELVQDDNGVDLKGLNIYQAANFLLNKFESFRGKQRDMVDAHYKNKKTSTPNPKCAHEGCCQMAQYCLAHASENNPEILDVQSSFKKFMSRSYDKVLAKKVAAEKEVQILYDEASTFYDNFDWYPLCPQFVRDSRAFKLLMSYYCVGYVKRRCLTSVSVVAAYHMMTTILCLLCDCNLATHIMVLLSCICQVSYLIWAAKETYYQKLATRDTLGLVQNAVLKRAATIVCSASALLAGLYLAAKLVQKHSRKLDIQGSLSPKTIKQIQERDAEMNVWAHVVRRDLPITDFSRRVSQEQLDNIVQKNLLYGTIYKTESEEMGMLNVLMLSSNVALVPNHYFTEVGESFIVDFKKNRPQSSGGRFTCRLEKKASVHILGSDLSLVYLPSGGSFKDILQHFPLENMPSAPFNFWWRNIDGTFVRAQGMTDPGVVRSVAGSYLGGYYRNFTRKTFEGMCGAVLTSATNGSVIVGMHLAGHAGTYVGAYGSVTKGELEAAMNELRQKEGILLTGSAGAFEKEVLGVQVAVNSPLHPKSALNYMPAGSQIEYYGSCPGRSVFKSDVIVSSISEHVITHCGVPNIYGPPKVHPDWYGWQTCLSNAAVPGTPFEYDLLEMAVKDYKEPLIELFRSELWNDARPLDDKTNLCGAPGKRFIDAIKLDTAIGFPLSGEKRRFVTELEPTPEFPNNRELDQFLLDEIDRCESLYAQGYRAYPIAKACKKDEILAKDKCRIFFSNPLSLTWLIRKYFLPIIRVLQMNPLVSECAVGVNAHGPEWDELHKHMHKFGEDRLIGGDYGKYDQKLPSQIIIAAMRILIDCARVCPGYNQESLRIMEAMAGDVAFAIIAFNGDLIGLTQGLHISGNSITVIVNGIGGSLNLRCAFYSFYPAENFEKRIKFRDEVAIQTYGDDNGGSASDKVSKFTIKNISKFLGEYGQIYTMPDKESELTDYLPPEDFEFLKRKSVYHPLLGCCVGALLDKSIYKSLHCQLRTKNSPLTEENVCAQNIDGALREWFNHGEEKYEAQRILMNKVASAANIAHMCTELNISYGERVIAWREKYLGEEEI